jgi:hypothetical protein
MEVITKFKQAKMWEFARKRYILDKAENDDVYRLIVYKTDKPGFGIWSRTSELIQSDNKIRQTLKSENLDLPECLLAETLSESLKN